MSDVIHKVSADAAGEAPSVSEETYIKRQIKMLRQQMAKDKRLVRQRAKLFALRLQAEELSVKVAQDDLRRPCLHNGLAEELSHPVAR